MNKIYKTTSGKEISLDLDNISDNKHFFLELGGYRTTYLLETSKGSLTSFFKVKDFINFYENKILKLDEIYFESSMLDLRSMKLFKIVVFNPTKGMKSEVATRNEMKKAYQYLCWLVGEKNIVNVNLNTGQPCKM